MTEIDYTIVRTNKLFPRVSIKISSEKGVVIRAPFWMTKGMIDSLVKEKKSWIEKNLKGIKQKITKKYENGEPHLFFGKEYFLKINQTSTLCRCKISIVESYFQVEIHESISKDKLPEKIKEAMLYWYLEKGIETITDKVNLYSQKIGVNYKKIDLKKVTSIWGSCSPSNCLSFNRKLVMAPHEVVDYVVIHEVAHMVHRNHGREFWELVAKFDPQYKQHRNWLRLNHHLLAI